MEELLADVFGIASAAECDASHFAVVEPAFWGIMKMNVISVGIWNLTPIPAGIAIVRNAKDLLGVKWLSARMEELLPVPYFHVVFTLPHCFNPLLACNKDLLYDLFFKKAAETLQEFALTPKHLGAQPGFIGVLHTWGQKLWYHVHLHFIITGGGWSAEKQCWIEHKRAEKFLYPVPAMSVVFRGKFIAGLKRLYRRGELEFPGDLERLEDDDSFDYFLNQAVSQRWVSYAKSPFSGPILVLKYISRYTHRVAISNDRLLEFTDKIVRFRYKDYKDHYKVKTLPLEPLEFMRRFLQHVLPKGFIRIRHFGFLAGNSKAKLLPKIRAFLKNQSETARRILEEGASQLESIRKSWELFCPECKKGSMITIHVEEVIWPLTAGFP